MKNFKLSPFYVIVQTYQRFPIIKFWLDESIYNDENEVAEEIYNHMDTSDVEAVFKVDLTNNTSENVTLHIAKLVADKYITDNANPVFAIYNWFETNGVDVSDFYRDI